MSYCIGNRACKNINLILEVEDFRWSETWNVQAERKELQNFAWHFETKIVIHNLKPSRNIITKLYRESDLRKNEI